MLHDFDLIAIGSGPAGQRAAVQAAKLGKRAAVIERRSCVGGVCIETGTVPSKTFREAVLSLTQRNGDGPRRPRPTMPQLLRRVGQVVQREAEVVEDQLARNGIELFRGRGAIQSPNSVRVDSPDGSRIITADNLLIAVGTGPADPPSGVSHSDAVITSDGVLELSQIPRTMAVVGGGVIGIEYASMFAQLGVQVTVVDRRPRPLEFLDFEIVDELIHQMRKHGVTFRGGEAVARLEVREGPTMMGCLELESGKHIAADTVLYCVGRHGATEGLGLEAIGVKPDERGRLVVDAQFRTSVPNVYAAGDVIGYPALAATSGEQGRLAACHMFGVASEPMRSHFPIGIYAIPEISMVGATEEELTAERIPYEIGVARYREIARGQILGDESGMFKMLFDRRDRRLLGVHCIGTGATELVHVGQAVYALGGGLDYFLSTVFNYPTFAECYKVAAYNAANKLQLAQPTEVANVPH